MILVLSLVATACSGGGDTAIYVEATLQAKALEKLQLEATVAAEESSKAISEAAEAKNKLDDELPPTPQPSATPQPSPTPAPTPYVKSSQELLVETISFAIVFIETQVGTGTGFVVSDNGLIITAAHVIEGYEKVTIRPNGSKFTGDAQVIYANYETDIAILSSGLNTPNFLTLDDSTNIGSGHEVIALGYPLLQEVDIQPSVSRGIISRPVIEDGISYFEHDARILSGNSGGPLMSVTTGNVLGLNVFLFSDDNGGGALYYAVGSSEIRSALLSSNAVKVVDNRYEVVPTPTPAPTSTPRPTPTPAPTSTPRPIPTATSTPFVVESYRSSACESGDTPTYVMASEGFYSKQLLVSDAETWEEETTKSPTEIGEFSPVSFLANGTFSAEFKVSTTSKSTFGTIFRSYTDDRMVVNSSAFDALIIKYVPAENSYGSDQVTWLHKVRNRFVTELTDDQTDVKSGIIQLTKFKIGPRGWNKLKIEVLDNKAWLYFNDEFVSELDIEMPSADKDYRTAFLSGYYKDELLSNIYYMRHPTVACID